MKAVVLAAGEGSRMWPLAENRPKHLLPIGGKPIIGYVLEALAENSINDVSVVVGFGSELIRSALGDGVSYGVRIHYLNQPRWTGTAAALKIAHEALGKEPFLALYGDLWVNASAVQSVVEKSQDCSKVMGLVRVANPSEYALVEVEGDRLRRIVEKPSGRQIGEGWVNAGIYVLDEEVFEAIEKTRLSKRSEYELTASLQRLLDERKEIRGAMIERDDWMDIGRPWDLLEANERVLSKLQHRVKGTVEQGSELRGPVWLQEGASVRSGCYIEGPVYIGKNSRVGPNARIRPFTYIGDDVIIGGSCEVKNSIIMNGTSIPHLSYVGDSIIGENCNLGAGTITANYRLDEGIVKIRIKGRLQGTGRKKLGVIMGDGAHTGINVSLMPGVRVGSNAWIGSETNVSEDVLSGFTVYVKQTVVRKRLKKRGMRSH